MHTRHSDSHGGADKLPETQTEEDGFLVVSDFLVDFDFDSLHLRYFKADLTTPAHQSYHATNELGRFMT